MNSHIERHISITSDEAGNVRTTTVTRAVISVDDAVAAADEGISDAGVSAADECFDVETCCDEREKAMIHALRAYLRPQVAPECLIARLHQCLADGVSEDAKRHAAR